MAICSHLCENVNFFFYIKIGRQGRLIYPLEFLMFPPTHPQMTCFTLMHIHEHSYKKEQRIGWDWRMFVHFIVPELLAQVAGCPTLEGNCDPAGGMK